MFEGGGDRGFVGSVVDENNVDGLLIEMSVALDIISSDWWARRCWPSSRWGKARRGAHGEFCGGVWRRTYGTRLFRRVAGAARRRFQLSC